MHIHLLSLGYHKIDIKCWRPQGSVRQEMESFFLGISSQLKKQDLIFADAWENRHSIYTISSGQVSLLA